MEGIPLAELLRPSSLDDIIGQDHLTGKDGVLRTIIKKSSLPSLIFWGPPGIGKTSLANVIANEVKLPFQTLSAISSGVKDVREIIETSKKRGKSVLFIDEIHRFNKSQQDALLGAVEKGWISLIGATTENPSFEVNAALLSRCQVYTLKSFGITELELILQRALESKWLKAYNLLFKETDALFRISGGDARKLLNLIELVASSVDPGNPVTNELVSSVVQQKSALYDKSGEMHYDIISAFIKSIRGSDPNAAVYWLARMIEGGEDLKFIARRMIIFASEDIGNANPTALVLATTTFQAVSVIGYPESSIILSQCATYLASSPKSNASYMAIKQAQNEVKQSGDLSIPLAIRNAPTKLMKELGYGKSYKYAHDYPGNFAIQEFLPDAIANTKFYDPGQNARENELRNRLKKLWGEKYGY